MTIQCRGGYAQPNSDGLVQQLAASLQDRYPDLKDRQIRITRVRCPVFSDWEFSGGWPQRRYDVDFELV